jgi:hypothetical protein
MRETDAISFGAKAISSFKVNPLSSGFVDTDLPGCCHSISSKVREEFITAAIGEIERS